MKNSLFTDEDFNLGWLILYIRRAINKARSRELLQYGITPEQAATLFVIRAIGSKATPAEISRWLLREQHSISYLLNRMKNKGLVRMVKDLERKNMIRIVLTKKGREASNESTKRESIHAIMSALPKKERCRLTSYLRTLLNKAVKEAGIEYEIPYPFTPLQ